MAIGGTKSSSSMQRTSPSSPKARRASSHEPREKSTQVLAAHSDSDSFEDHSDGTSKKSFWQQHVGSSKTVRSKTLQFDFPSGGNVTSSFNMQKSRPRANSNIEGGETRSFMRSGGSPLKFFPLSTEQMNSAVAIKHPVPKTWPTATWDPMRLQRHWSGKKKGKGKATPHHTEFEVLGIPKIKTASDFAKFSQAFMSSKQPKRDHVLERMSLDNTHILRYDYNANLYGSINKETGKIGTFFRPGYKVGIGPFPKQLEPNIRGFAYFKRYVETGVGKPDRGKVQHEASETSSKEKVNL